MSLWQQPDLKPSPTKLAAGCPMFAYADGKRLLSVQSRYGFCLQSISANSEAATPAITAVFRQASLSKFRSVENVHPFLRRRSHKCLEFPLFFTS